MILAVDHEQYRWGIILALMILFAISATIWFDQIIRYLYEERRDIWEAEERPCGILYSPPGARHWHTSAREYGMSWTLRTPPWMRDETFCLRRLRMLRWLEIASVVAVLIVWFAPII